MDVLGRRENGYHDVRMVMQTIYLYDEVKLTKKKEPGIELTTNLGFLPTGDTNIAYKAAKLLIEEFGISEGVKIVLNKHIPVAAGLAGCLIRDEPHVRTPPAAKRSDGTWGKAGSRCALLYYERDGAGRRDRRGIKCPPCHAEMYGSDRKATGQCINQSSL